MKPEDVTLLREALPYINKFSSKVFLIRFGGEVTQDLDRLFSLSEEVALLHRVGIHVVVVHGGSRQAQQLAQSLGVEPKIADGRPVTDEKMLQIVKMVYAGQMNTDVLLALKRAGVAAVGVSGVDGGLVSAKARSGDEAAAEGKQADVVTIDVSILKTLLDREFVPVVSPLAADEAGVLYNINPDTIAARLAAALGAEKLVLASAVDAVFDGSNAPISRLTPEQATQLIDRNVIKGGMLGKIQNSLHALKNGVRSVHIINGTKPASLLEEIFTEKGSGTMLYDDLK